VKVKGKSKADHIYAIQNTVLDLSNLSRYSRESLLEYCKTEDIEADSESTKEQLIAIVDSYNNKEADS